MRVDSLEWQDVRPKPYVPEEDKPQANGHGEEKEDLAAAEARELKEREEENPMRKAGLKIIAGISESGLGITSWWSGGNAGEEGIDGEGAVLEEEGMEGM